MAISTNLKVALTNYKWAVKVLESSQTREHLDCAEKCFNLWDNKYLSSEITVLEKRFLRRLRNSFWSSYHQKRIFIIFKKKLISVVKN